MKACTQVPWLLGWLERRRPSTAYLETLSTLLHGLELHPWYDIMITDV